MYKDKGGNGEVVQAIKAHFDIVDYAQRRGLSFTRKGSELYCNEMHGVCIDPNKQTFYNHKLEKGGSVIDFVMMTDNLSLGDAVSKLRKEMGNYEPAYSSVKYQKFKELEKAKDFILPKAHNGQYSRVFAYLGKSRGIDGKVIGDMVKRKLLYEDSNYHNCVFVGYDYDGKAKFACKRVTIDSTRMPKYYVNDLKSETQNKGGIFINGSSKTVLAVEVSLNPKILGALIKDKGIENIYLFYQDTDLGKEKAELANKVLKELGYSGNVGYSLPEKWYSSTRQASYKAVTQPYTRSDVENSKKEIGWFVDNNKPTLFVCEAPIDAMSIMSLMSLGGKDYNGCSYLAQGGAGSIKTLEYHLKKNTDIDKIYLAYDNDEAGIKAISRARDMLTEIGFKGKVIDKLPIKNDFNDDLKAHRELAKQIEQQNTIGQTMSNQTTKPLEEQLCISR